MDRNLVIVTLVLLSFLGTSLVEATRVLKGKTHVSAPSHDEHIGNNEDEDELNGSGAPSTTFAEEGPVGGPVSPGMFKDVPNYSQDKSDLPFRLNNASALESLPFIAITTIVTLSFFLS